MERGATNSGKDEAVVELATALGRYRALSDRESRLLERSLKDMARLKCGGNKPWTKDQDRLLLTKLNKGKRPPVIALEMKRTVRAIWRRMSILGVGVGGKGSIARRTVNSDVRAHG